LVGFGEGDQKCESSEIEKYRENEMLICEEKPEELDKGLVRIILKHAPDGVKKVLGSIWNEQRTMCARILFVGEPGTGKTTLAIAIAQALRDKVVHANLVRTKTNKQHSEQKLEVLEPLKFEYKLLDTPQLAGEVQNSGERNIKRAFSEIISKSQGRCVIISDELDKLVAPLRSANFSQDHDKGPAQALNTVLNSCLRQPNVVVIGTTNDLDSLPPALKSRFERNTFTIEMPDYNYRRDIINYLFEKYKDKLDKSCLMPCAIDRLAKRTSRLSIRQIIEAIEETVNSTEPFDLTNLETIWSELENPSDESGLSEATTATSSSSNESDKSTTQKLASLKEIDKALQKKRPWWFSKYWDKVRKLPEKHSDIYSIAKGIGSHIAVNIWNHGNILLSKRFSWWPGSILIGHERMLNISLLGYQLARASQDHLNRHKHQKVLDHSVQAAEWAEEDRDEQKKVLSVNASDVEESIQRQKEQLELGKDQFYYSLEREEERPSGHVSAGNLQIHFKNKNELRKAYKEKYKTKTDQNEKKSDDGWCSVM